MILFFFNLLPIPDLFSKLTDIILLYGQEIDSFISACIPLLFEHLFWIHVSIVAT